MTSEMIRPSAWCHFWLPVMLFFGIASSSQAQSAFAVEQRGDRLILIHRGRPFADYVFREDKILRPYFANVRTTEGIQVTRNHPPVAGKDATDHATMHPGIWMGFGDIGGHDFWRNKAAIQHERFLEEPAVRENSLRFAALNRLVSPEGARIGQQLSRIHIHSHPAGYLLVWEAIFRSEIGDFYFGDQEEMGLGVRVATAIAEKNGGQIMSSAGVRTAKSTWGKPADWCDYSGTADGRWVGMTIMCDPQNFRPSWFHNRDYGVMVANPFGRKALTGGEPSRVEVQRGHELPLRFGILIHSSKPGEPLDLAKAYSEFAGSRGSKSAAGNASGLLSPHLPKIIFITEKAVE